MPAGQLDSGITILLFGFKLDPKETGFGVGERGFEKGCAMPVDVAAGVPAVRGDAVVEGSNWGRDEEIVRAMELEERRGREERRQRAQIMLGVWCCSIWDV